MKRKFNIIGVGGTFDQLHRGHRALLLKAFELGDFVWIGLCTDAFARKIRKAREIASYRERMKELNCFLGKMSFRDRAEIIPLADGFGPAVSSKEQQAIVVSRETEAGAREINKVRRRNGLPPLEVVVIDMVPAENDVSISTTRIRQGEIDREGHLLCR